MPCIHLPTGPRAAEVRGQDGKFPPLQAAAGVSGYLARASLPEITMYRPWDTSGWSLGGMHSAKGRERLSQGGAKQKEHRCVVLSSSQMTRHQGEDSVQRVRSLSQTCHSAGTGVRAPLKLRPQKVLQVTALPCVPLVPR